MRLLLRVALCLAASAAVHEPLPPPFLSYPPLGPGAYSGAPAPASPDPLVRYRWDTAPIAAQHLQAYRRRPLAVLDPIPLGFSGADTLLRASAGPRAMRVTARGSIGFDFGSECAGWLEFDSPELGPQLQSRVAVLLSSSEFTLPQFTTPTGENNNGNCTGAARSVPGIPGRFQLAVNSELYEGLRYGWLHALPVVGGGQFNFTVTNLSAVCQVIPINYPDRAFEADGPVPQAGAEPGSGARALEEVWYTAMYTTRVDLLPGGFGSILMDRGDRISWTGDAHLAQKAALTGFGGQHGSLMVQQNTERTKAVDNGIISYDMYFVLSVADYFMHTNDTVSLSGWAPLVEKKFETSISFWAKPSAQGFCGSDPRIGADFEHSAPSEAEKTRYYKMLTIQAAREYARAAGQCYACNASVREGAARLGAQFTSYMERERALLIKPCTDSYDGCYGMHAATNAVLTGLTTPAEEQQIYDHLLSNPAHICSFSPFNTYFILEATSRLRLEGGRQQAMRAALLMLRRCFHGMNRLGATTYWETFSPEWNRLIAAGAPTPNSQTGYMSHCHPWASGPAPWITANLVGLRSVEPGWGNFSAIPFLDPAPPILLSAVSGVQPLQTGHAIRAGFACNGSSSLVVPPGTVAGLVALPLCGAKPRSLAINGKLQPSLDTSEDALLVRNLQPGSYKFLIGLTGPERAMIVPPSAVASYRDRFIGTDDSTAGDWRGKYGLDGYLMWSLRAAQQDEQKLPLSISSITVNTPYTGVVGPKGAPNFSNCTSDRRALEPSSSQSVSSECRALGARLGGTTATIDINGTGTHNVSLYLVDWAREGRRVAVELREYHNLQLAAPTQYVDNMTEGTWMTWETALPSRLRLHQVQPPLPNNNALLLFSGLFFGTSL